MMSRRILVCSIGNPGQLLQTRHSAGHTALELIRKSLNAPALEKDRKCHGSFAESDPYTFFHSLEYMNTSGKSVGAAWRKFLRELTPLEKEKAVLVVLHDELEKELGVIRVKKTGSAKGHNGLRSIIDCLGTREFYRIGVGIGRPASRESPDVQRHVLGKFTSHEKDVIESKSSYLVEALQRIADGKE